MSEPRDGSGEGGTWTTGNQIERDLILTDADFLRIRELIYQRAGIVLAEHKREMVYSRLARRLRHHGLTRFTDYLTRLERQPDAREWEAFTNALTTNLTAFFREAHHFPLLAEHVRHATGPVNIWCSAASTGEEPYSIAMTLLETLGGRAANARIVATDIDTDALAKAQAGIYPQEQVRKLDEARVKRFFQKGTGSHAGLARVRPEVMAMVEFLPLNLLAPSWPVKGPFDAIFCRNIMIYFDKQTQTAILKRFAPLMKRDGLLFAGHSENFSYISNAFKLRGQTVYTLADSGR
ncbi:MULTISPECIES: CheR family methyltransferase [unclassified Halomonas]|uniref:CheR family methyltransferase n=1 Tax=unclassified Halomonas TaxID=2609666 RepID=UPI00209E2DA2|nr:MULTISPECIES: CheR family methyltransferase [unclassified Halomonas]MCP1314938.1 chemotaxis protein CheR [Halomonas sp. 707D7]MCP1326231.1 chemotaxis protein CheR [Halomonas sp. 707D4]